MPVCDPPVSYITVQNFFLPLFFFLSFFSSPHSFLPCGKHCLNTMLIHAHILRVRLYAIFLLNRNASVCLHSFCPFFFPPPFHSSTGPLEVIEDSSDEEDDVAAPPPPAPAADDGDSGDDDSEEGDSEEEVTEKKNPLKNRKSIAAGAARMANPGGKSEKKKGRKTEKSKKEKKKKKKKDSDDEELSDAGDDSDDALAGIDTSAIITGGGLLCTMPIHPHCMRCASSAPLKGSLALVALAVPSGEEGEGKESVLTPKRNTLASSLSVCPSLSS